MTYNEDCKINQSHFNSPQYSIVNIFDSRGKIFKVFSIPEVNHD